MRCVFFNYICLKWRKVRDILRSVNKELAKDGKTNVDKKAIESLVSIAKQTKSLIMLVCDVNYDQTDSFGLNLSDLAPKTTIYASGDIIT